MQNILSSSLLAKYIYIYIYIYRERERERENIENNKFACFLYGFETWSLILREERKLRVFGNRVLSRIFGP